MQTLWIVGLVFAAVLMAASPGRATAPTRAEMARARAWAAEHLADTRRAAADAPFSFTYGGKPSSELLKSWKATRASRKLDAARTERVLTYTDPATGLAIACRAVEYRDFPTVEWTLTLKNTGAADTPIIEGIQALDIRLQRGGAGEFMLHSNHGDDCTPSSYTPEVRMLAANTTARFVPNGGRPTNGAFPYWNVEMPGEGVIAVIGWPGQWAAEFIRDDARGLRIKAGQELTHFVLHPDEEVRTPLAVLQFYVGDPVRAQNVWRRWFVAHNIPRPNGKLVPTHYAACGGNLQPTAADELAWLDGYVREGVKLDFWILDAGWYPDKGGWWNTGTWEVDKTRFPNGLKELSDRAHANGMKFVVWFEPQRAAAGSWLTENHPEWILGGAQGGLVNLGNPEAWKWVVDRVSGLLTSEGIDAYRQDFNIDPLGYWRANDTPDRQGITEIRDVMGYLAYWDELVKRHPGLWIDSCASGGRRNDLETMRRSVPLLRSDCFDTAEAQQSQTHGVSTWIPYHGSGLGEKTAYWFRSCIFPASRVGWDTKRTDLDYALLKRMVAEFRQVEPYLLADYYPLTPHTVAPDAWLAWQFDAPERGEGAVQAFRRPGCTSDSLVLHLRGVDPAAVYAVTNLDDGKQERVRGSDLMGGWRVTLSECPGAGIWVYKRVR